MRISDPSKGFYGGSMSSLWLLTPMPWDAVLLSPKSMKINMKPMQIHEKLRFEQRFSWGQQVVPYRGNTHAWAWCPAIT